MKPQDVSQNLKVKTADFYIVPPMFYLTNPDEKYFTPLLWNVCFIITIFA